MDAPCAAPDQVGDDVDVVALRLQCQQGLCGGQADHVDGARRWVRHQHGLSIAEAYSGDSIDVLRGRSLLPDANDSG